MGTVSASARISKDQYDKLVAAFREKPGLIVNAARVAGVQDRTASRAWHEGWVRPVWARSIKDVLEEEQAQSEIDLRARLQRTEIETLRTRQETREVVDRELAMIDAVEERAREAKVVRAAMQTALGSQGIAALFAQSAVPLVKQSAEGLAKEIKDGKVQWREGLRTSEKILSLAEQAGRISMNAMEMLRKHFGAAEKIIGHIQSAEPPSERVISALGSEEEVRMAILDLAEGRMSDRVLKLIELRSATGSIQ